MNNESAHKEYWIKRGNMSYTYKGEIFYTIAHIPYYYRRRNILLKYLSKEIEKLSLSEKNIKIHDYGCGDGWYLNYFYKLYPKIEFSGYDISESFIERAKSVLLDKITLDCGNTDKIDKNGYDLIYSIAVFAHITNEDIPTVFSNIYDNLRIGGRFLIFEQTSGGSYAIERKTNIRRLASEYEQIASKTGFVLIDKVAIDFSVHRFFERFLAKKLYNLYKGDTIDEKRINANKNIFFRFLCNIACILSFFPIKIKNKNYWGNTLFVFEKI